MELFLTIDAGGTSTRALVHDADGNCFGSAVAGGGNPTASGVEAVAGAISSAATQAISAADARPADMTHAFAAMAGSAVGVTTVGRGLVEAGIRVGLQLGNDLEAVFFSGTAELSGVSLVSGTGAAAVVVENGVRTARSDGRGWLLGDVGSGYWIARRVVRAAAADLDHRGPRTALTEALLLAAGIGGDRSTGSDALLDQLVATIYAIPTPGIARFAPLVFDVEETDDLARRIIDEAAEGLATTVLALRSADTAGPLVVGGSVLFHQNALRSRVAGLLHDAGWTGPVLPVADGLLGAICMNLRAAGRAVDEGTHARIMASLNETRSRA